MAKIWAKIFIGFFCLIIIHSGETAANTVGNWEVTVTEKLENTTTQPSSYPLNLFISQNGTDFSIEFYSPTLFKFPEIIKNALLDGNTLSAEKEINFVKHKLTLFFDHNNHSVKGSYTTNQFLLIFPVENNYEISGHLSHESMLERWRSNQQALKMSCTNKILSIREKLGKHIKNLHDNLHTCIGQSHKIGEKADVLQSRLKEEIVKNKTQSTLIISLNEMDTKSNQKIKHLNTSLVNQQDINKKIKQDNQTCNVNNKNIHVRLDAMSKEMTDNEDCAARANELKQSIEEITQNVINLRSVVAKQKKDISKSQKYRNNLKLALKKISYMRNESEKNHKTKTRDILREWKKSDVENNIQLEKCQSKIITSNDECATEVNKLNQKIEEITQNVIKLRSVVAQQKKDILESHEYQNTLKKALKKISHIRIEEKKEYNNKISVTLRDWKKADERKKLQINKCRSLIPTKASFLSLAEANEMMKQCAY